MSNSFATSEALTTTAPSTVSSSGLLGTICRFVVCWKESCFVSYTRNFPVGLVITCSMFFLLPRNVNFRVLTDPSRTDVKLFASVLTSMFVIETRAYVIVVV